MSTTIITDLCHIQNGDRGIVNKIIAAAPGSDVDYAKIHIIPSSHLTHRKRFDKELIDIYTKEDLDIAERLISQ